MLNHKLFAVFLQESFYAAVERADAADDDDDDDDAQPQQQTNNNDRRPQKLVRYCDTACNGAATDTLLAQRLETGPLKLLLAQSCGVYSDCSSLIFL